MHFSILFVYSHCRSGHASLHSSEYSSVDGIPGGRSRLLRRLIFLVFPESQHD